MPLARILQILHCEILAAGGNTEWEIPFPDEIAAIDARIERLKKQKGLSPDLTL